MRNPVIFILVGLFVFGSLMLVGCVKKPVPTAETPETAEVTPETAAPVPETLAPETSATVEEAPAEEGAPGEGGK
jgi:hypothetical protein